MLRIFVFMVEHKETTAWYIPVEVYFKMSAVANKYILRTELRALKCCFLSDQRSNFDRCHYFEVQRLIMSTEAKVEEGVPPVELSPAELAKK